MNPATNNRASVSEILAALSAALTAAQWTPVVDQPVAAFQTVKLFDLANIATAFKELTVADQRVCFIIADAEHFADKFSNSTDQGVQRALLMTRKLPVALLISDRVIGDRTTALYGGMNGTVKICGAEGLKEIALTAVTGQLLANPNGVVVRPTTSAVMDVKDMRTNLPGRACVELDLECTGGTLAADLGPGRNL